jgi:16S rRNA processing protein RimM
MHNLKYTNIGRTQKVHGTEGELKVHLFEEFTEDFIAAEFIFLDIDGGKVPFLVENIRMNETPFILFEDILNNNDAVPYTAKQMYLRREDVLKEEERQYDFTKKETLLFRKYKGFKIIDLNAGEVGVIEDIIEMPQQEMAQVIYKGNEILLPMNDALIESVDNKAMIVVMDLPEGILEL